MKGLYIILLLLAASVCLSGCTNTKYPVATSSPYSTAAVEQETTTQQPSAETPTPTDNATALTQTVTASITAPQDNTSAQPVLSDTWINQTFVRQGGLWVSLNMPEPAAFPDTLYQYSLKEGTNRTAMAQNIQPQRMMATEYGVGGEPAFLPRASQQHQNSLLVMCDGQYLGTDTWAWQTMDKNLFDSLYNAATELMQQRDFPYAPTPSVYRSRLTDGTPIVKMLFTRELDGLQMHSGMYADKNATNGNGRSWGYSSPEYVLLMMYEDGTVYYLYQSGLSAVVSRQALSTAPISYTVALQNFVTDNASSFMNKHIVVYSVQPCYVKLAVSGSYESFTAVPGWEIGYYICTDNTSDFTESCWHGKVCVNAITGEVLGK